MTYGTRRMRGRMRMLGEATSSNAPRPHHRHPFHAHPRQHLHLRPLRTDPRFSRVPGPSSRRAMVRPNGAQVSNVQMGTRAQQGHTFVCFHNASYPQASKRANVSASKASQPRGPSAITKPSRRAIPSPSLRAASPSASASPSLGPVFWGKKTAPQIWGVVRNEHNRYIESNSSCKT